MKCPNCQAANSDTNRFCPHCGTKLSKLCPGCGSERLPGDRFCAECGNDLALPAEQPVGDLSFEDKLEKIQRYLPGGLTEKILAQVGRRPARGKRQGIDQTEIASLRSH